MSPVIAAEFVIRGTCRFALIFCLYGLIVKLGCVKQSSQRRSGVSDGVRKGRRVAISDIERLRRRQDRAIRSAIAMPAQPFRNALAVLFHKQDYIGNPATLGIRHEPDHSLIALMLHCRIVRSRSRARPSPQSRSSVPTTVLAQAPCACTHPSQTSPLPVCIANWSSVTT